MTKDLTKMARCHRLGLWHKAGQIWPLDATSSTWRRAENPARQDSAVGRQHGKWLVARVSLCRHQTVRCDTKKVALSRRSDATGRGRRCITLFVNLFWHAKYFHFCSGSRSTKDGVECSAHCGGAIEEDLPSAHQMWELKVVVRGD